MKTLFIITLLLIILFSFSSSCYLVYYKYPFKNDLLKAILFLVQGIVFTLVVFTVCLTIVWPPV